MSFLDTDSLLKVATLSPMYEDLMQDRKCWYRVDLSEISTLSIDIHVRFLMFPSWTKIFIMQGSKYLDLYTIEEILAPLTSLKTVILNGNFNFSSLHFLTCLPNLTKLEIDNCHSLNPYCFVHQLPKYGQDLVHLSLNGNDQLTKHDLIKMAKALPNFKYLSIMGCDCLPPGRAETVLSNCTNLKTFNFSSHFFLDDAKAWVSLLEDKFPNVKYSQETQKQIFWYKNFYLPK